MLDRFGHPIRLGWSDHQIIWIRAAMTLEGQERRDAFYDISELTGRSYAAVWHKAWHVRLKDQEDATRLRMAEAKRAWLADIGEHV